MEIRGDLIYESQLHEHWSSWTMIWVQARDWFEDLVKMAMKHQTVRTQTLVLTELLLRLTRYNKKEMIKVPYHSLEKQLLVFPESSSSLQWLSSHPDPTEAENPLTFFSDAINHIMSIDCSHTWTNIWWDSLAFFRLIQTQRLFQTPRRL